MDRMAGPGLRWLRAAIVGGLTLLVGAVAHVSADGLLPDPGVMAAIGGGAVLLSAALLGRPATRARIVAATVIGQTVIHGALSVTAGHRHAGPVAEPDLGTCLDPPAAAVSGEVLMTLLHLVAATLVGMWLASGEQALWTLIVLGVCLVLQMVGSLIGGSGISVAWAPPRVGSWRLPVPRQRTVIRHTVVRRGPPLVVA